MTQPKYTLTTAHPVALASPDHTHPRGTMLDNSTNAAFNAKLYAMAPMVKLSVMDLGCSGGGFVKSLIDDGHAAIGVEGSDYSQRAKRAEWATIPDNLFTADITKPFSVQCDGTPATFDVITAWEVIEHIAEADLVEVCSNVRRHLAPGGIWIMSVCPVSEDIDDVRYHQTIQPFIWWLEYFTAEGFDFHGDIVAHFGSDWIRGPWQLAPRSFHLVLSLAGEPLAGSCAGDAA